jgi:hypothetical protein
VLDEGAFLARAFESFQRIGYLVSHATFPLSHFETAVFLNSCRAGFASPGGAA